MGWYSKDARRMYATGRPNARARRLNAFWARVGRLGLGGSRLVTIDVVGRRSGAVVAVPLIPARYLGQLYLASMLGAQANWVKNVRAAGGHVVLHQGRRHDRVVLEEIPVSSRAPIIKAFLAAAPGARPHVPVDRQAPLRDFERVAAQIPVFAVRPDRSSPVGQLFIQP